MQLTKMSTSRISGKGPPLAVSSRSHLRMSSLTTHHQYRRACYQGHVLVQPDLPEKVYCTSSTSSKSPNNQGLDSFTATAQLGLDIGDHRGLILIRLQKTEGFALALRGESKGTSGRTSEPSMESKGRDPSPTSIIQEFDIVQGTSPVMEAGQNCRPPGLLLVTMRKLNVGVGKGIG